MNGRSRIRSAISELKLGAVCSFRPDAVNGLTRTAKAAKASLLLSALAFFMLPNTVSGIYRFKYADRQVLVPYGEGGGGLFTFMETRDDSKGPKFGAAPTAFAAGGLNILIDGVDRDAMKNLRQDYAINHLYLNAEFREIIGFGKFNFGSRVICGGLGAEF